MIYNLGITDGKKSQEEIAELERAAAIGYEMHTTAMKLCRAGITEHYIGGALDGSNCV